MPTTVATTADNDYAPINGTLRLKVVEIAPSENVASSQTAALMMLITLARGFTAPLAQNTANNTLKELLKTAEVTQHRERVEVTATVTPSLLGSMTSDENALPEAAPETGAPAPK